MHFYLPNGTPCHGELDDARLSGAWPSVTTVLGVLDNPSVDEWNLCRHILAAKADIEAGGRKVKDETFVKRVKKAVADGENATDIGTDVHWAIETGDSSNEYAAPVIDWLLENVEQTDAIEHVITNPQYLYAGTIDRVVWRNGFNRPCIIDFKTQNVKGDEAVFYKNYKLQLAAYREAYDINCDCGSIVIDKNKPGRIFVKFYEREEIDRAWIAFRGILEAWKFQNDYYPQTT